MSFSLIKYPSLGGGSTSPAGSDTEVQFNNAGAFGASPSMVFSEVGFAGAFPSLTMSNSNLPSIQILTTVNDIDSNGPVLFFGNTTGDGLVWQFFMPSKSKGFGAFNRNVFNYSYYCTFDTNNTIIGGTTGSGTPPPDNGNRLQVNGTASITNSGVGTILTLGASNTPVNTIAYDPNNGNIVHTSNFGGFQFNTAGSAFPFIVGNGNLLIGTNTDNGSKLQVNGTARLVVQEFVDNAAAITGGLVVGTIYRNGDILQIVH